MICPTKPFNFSWIVENRLAGCGLPETKENLQFLKCAGIKGIISLTENGLQNLDHFPGEFSVLSCKIEEFTPPTMQQVLNCIGFIERHNELNEAVCVHCRHGWGRTGTIIACYMVKHFKLTANEAMDRLWEMRPGSVETREQENMVILYEEYLLSTSEITTDPQTNTKLVHVE
ncbi:dual specificity protein phosphatase 23-like [Mya arenaria]|uniref:dual specificity protein phosphatase 23-like n=1 Tax=Mya arenaria TaxID=6604 RepID=UPI0022E69B47|nr:dual specificity protein phosphatase 23-like [Mya arenaria]